jgi:hypothetical protein
LNIVFANHSDTGYNSRSDQLNALGFCRRQNLDFFRPSPRFRRRFANAIDYNTIVGGNINHKMFFAYHILILKSLKVDARHTTTVSSVSLIPTENSAGVHNEYGFGISAHYGSGFGTEAAAITGRTVKSFLVTDNETGQRIPRRASQQRRVATARPRAFSSGGRRELPASSVRFQG